MKYKITVASLTPSAEGYDSDVVFLQVIDVDEPPVSEIARLLNPEPDYEETDPPEVVEKPEITHTERHLENANIHFIPAGDRLINTKSDFETSLQIVGRKGREPSYDREAMIADIKANVLTVAQIADKYGVIKQTVYNVRSRFVPPSEIAEDLAPEPTGPLQAPIDPPPTPYMESRERLQSEEPEPIEKKIELMVAEGLSMSELEMMFPSVPITTIREIFEQYT